MILALILQVTSAQPLPPDVWAALSSSASLARSSQTVEFLRDGTTLTSDNVTLRLTSRSYGETQKVFWTNSRMCPGAVDAVRGLRSVPLPTPVLPGDPQEFVLDGVQYKARFNAHYGSEAGTPIELNSNAGTPLARWMIDTFAKLKPCWSKTRPG